MWVGVPIIFSGFFLGSFYALIALGFSLILGTGRAFNLAHGEMILLSGYLAFTLWQYFQVPFFWILLICSLVLMWLTIPLHFLLRRLPEPYGLNTLMVTLVFSFFGGSKMVWGPVLGAFILYPLEQLLLMPLFPMGHSALYGLVIILTIFFFPRGIAAWLPANRKPV